MSSSALSNSHVDCVPSFLVGSTCLILLIQTGHRRPYCPHPLHSWGWGYLQVHPVCAHFSSPRPLWRVRLQEERLHQGIFLKQYSISIWRDCIVLFIAQYSGIPSTLFLNECFCNSCLWGEFSSPMTSTTWCPNTWTSSREWWVISNSTWVMCQYELFGICLDSICTGI